MTRSLALAATAFLALAAVPASAANLINGGFESPVIGAETYSIMSANSVTGWQTTASDNQVELWSNKFLGVPAFEGAQFAELNANMVSTLYQDVNGIAAGNLVAYEFAHRGREGVDTMRFTLTDLGANGVAGGGDDMLLVSRLVADGNTGWGFYSGSGIAALGNTVRVAFESVSSVGGDSYGNLLDAAVFSASGGSTSGAPIPEPASMALLGAGLFGLAAFGRRRFGKRIG